MGGEWKSGRSETEGNIQTPEDLGFGPEVRSGLTSNSNTDRSSVNKVQEQGGEIFWRS